MDEKTLRVAAAIAHVGLTDEEMGDMLTAIDRMEDLLGVLDEFQGGEGIAAFSPIEFSDALREDVPETYPSERLLEDMNTYEGYVRGPKIV